jgi:type II secretory pathway pseudopilin PulG
MDNPIAIGNGQVLAPSKGFTLLGVLFIVVGLGIGMAALGKMWHTASQREKEKELLFIGDQYRRAIESFWRLSPGGVKRLPKNFEELLADPRFPTIVRHLRRIYRDPMSREGKWGIVKEPEGGISGIYSISEGSPFKNAGFEPEYQHFSGAKTYQEWVFRFDVEKAVKEAAVAARRGTPTSSGTLTPGTPEAN